MEKVKCILIGRHSLGGENLEVIRQENITFPVTSDKCHDILFPLFEEAKAHGAALVFQGMPGQVAVAVAGMVDNDTAFQAGVIVSVPDERPAGHVAEGTFETNLDASLAAELVKSANPRAKIEQVIELGGPKVKVTADPPMRFEFSHIEWF